MSAPIGRSHWVDLGGGSMRTGLGGASSTVTSGVPSTSQKCSASGKNELHSGQRFNYLAPGRSYTILTSCEDNFDFIGLIPCLSAVIRGPLNPHSVVLTVDRNWIALPAL